MTQEELDELKRMADEIAPRPGAYSPPGRAQSPAMPMQQAPAQTPPAPAAQPTELEMADRILAMKNAGNQRMWAGLQGAAATFSNALGGNVDMRPYEQMKQDAERPVQDFDALQQQGRQRKMDVRADEAWKVQQMELQRKAASERQAGELAARMRDPNSIESQTARQLAERLDPKLASTANWQTATAESLGKFYPMIKDAVGAELERDKLADSKAERQFKMDQDSQKMRADGAEKLRKELLSNPATKEAMVVKVAFGKVQAAATSRNGPNGAPSAADDMALVFGYMKLLDPGSTVREGEYANAQNATGVPGQVTNIYNRVLAGNILNDQQRREFLKAAQDAYQQQVKVYGVLADQYEGLARRMGVPVEDVVLDLGFTSGGGTPAPQGARPPEPMSDAQRRVLEQFIAANPNDPDAAEIRERLGVAGE